MPTMRKRFINGLHRFNLLAGRMLRRQFPAYRLSRGKIRPAHVLTINVVDHCNLSCRDCNHASPAMPEFFADPQIIREDLAFLAPYYKPGIVTIQGGEPLLHPNLPEVIEAIRSTGICRYITITTNGLLLKSMPDELWEAVNHIELSLYPETGFDATRIEELRTKAARHRTRLTPSWFGDYSFRTAFSLRGTEDDQLVERIYRSCKISNYWGCHVVHKGRFYKCSPSVYIPEIPGCRAGFSPQDSGLPLHREGNFLEELWAYLDTPEPLPACRFCLGTVGKVRPQKQVRAGAWPLEYDFPTEALVDMEILQAAERGVDLDLERHVVDKT